MRVIEVRNPRNGEYDYACRPLEGHGLKEEVSRLRRGQVRWQAYSVEQRIEVMQRWAESFSRHRDAVLEGLILDTGRKSESVLEVNLMAQTIRRWCHLAESIFKDQEDKTSNIPSICIKQQVRAYPLVGVISPWNFPLLLACIDTIPAILAGCSVLVKPSEITPRFIEPLMASIREIPELADILSFVPGDGITGSEMIPMVDLLCFTGSVATGKSIYEACARNFIPCFLELGGKDPALVFEGANLEHAASSILWGSTVNNGQSCLSIERVYVQKNIETAFLEILKRKMERVKIAYPNLDDGQIGPIIAEKQVNIIQEQLDDALAKGAEIILGRSACEQLGGGWFIRPTLLSGVNHQMKIMQEETFGPLIPVMSFDSEEEAIALANGTQFGLSAAIFHKDREKAYQIGLQIDAGAISLNECALTALVHEGEKQAFKMSGIGGTRMGPAAIKRFLRQKAFLINKSESPSPWWFP
jgi:acyl-CoA reductase-like NAD-dependent aldehyde dehydrogenase